MLIIVRCLVVGSWLGLWLGLYLVSCCYAHVFVLLYVIIVTLPRKLRSASRQHFTVPSHTAAAAALLCRRQSGRTA